MAATGSTPISLYYTTTASAAPTAGNLVNGELAINITDGKLFYKDNAGAVQTIAQKGGVGVSSFSAGTTGLTPSTTTTGAVTLAGTLAVANGGTGVTTSTGSGNNVLSTSPTLVTPILGTPTSATLTNATGLPLSTGVTGTLPAANGGTAQSTYATGDIIYASASNTLSKLAVGTTGQVLTVASGAPTWSTASGGSGQGGRGQAFTSNGTFTIPTGITSLKITVLGGGGGGNGGASNGSGGGNSTVASGTQSITTLTGGGGASGAGGAGGGIGTNGTLNIKGGSGTGGGLAGGNSIFGAGGPGGASGGAYGGGGGGGGGVAGFGQAAGGAGGAAIKFLTGLTPGNTLSVTIGGGGNGGGGNCCYGSGGAGGAGVVLFEW